MQRGLQRRQAAIGGFGCGGHDQCEADEAVYERRRVVELDGNACGRKQFGVTGTVVT